MKIELTDNDIQWATSVGERRQLEAIRRGLKDKAGAEYKNGRELHIEGAAGELAASRCLGVHWPAGVNTGKLCDIPPNIEVRTRSDPSYDLMVRKGDVENLRYLLVIGRMPHYNVIGWIRGYAAMKNKYWKDPNGRGAAWFVPKEDLYSVERLIELLAMDEVRVA